MQPCCSSPWCFQPRAVLLCLITLGLQPSARATQTTSAYFNSTLNGSGNVGGKLGKNGLIDYRCDVQGMADLLVWKIGERKKCDKFNCAKGESSKI